jgi:CheY-like chemotaxis protein
MSKRILVVEDQPDNRQIIRDMLAPTDYEITEAENGEEALAARSHPDGYPAPDHGRLYGYEPD